MPSVNMLEAKSSLSKLVDALERGQEKEFIIARNGKPAAKLVPIAHSDPSKRIGIADGLFDVPEDDPELNEEIAKMFTGA
jgi:prevent-host-death family protein